MPIIQLTAIPAFSAIYYALLQNGYEFAEIDRDEHTVQMLRQFADDHEAFPYFAQVRQKSCAVYPFWPRAALLETASFFLSNDDGYSDTTALKRTLCSYSNIAVSEFDESFWTWLSDFPLAMQAVRQSKGFQTYLKWEHVWQQKHIAHDLTALKIILSNASRIFDYSLIRYIDLVISPIKCVYSADYHLFQNRFIFSSGRFDTASVVHEVLHPAVHPIVLANREKILRSNWQSNDLDPSYYLDGNSSGILNAFEEILVRTLTNSLVSGLQMPDPDACIASILSCY